MKNFWYPSLLLAVLHLHAQPVPEGFIRTPRGLWVKMIHDAGAPKARPSDIMKINAIYSTGYDSVLFSTYDAQTGPMQLTIGEPAYAGDPMEVFALLGAGDSAIILLPTDSVFKNQKDWPPFARPGQFIKVQVKVVDLVSKDEFERRRAEEAARRLQQESILIEDYLKRNNLSAQRTASGLYYIIEKQGNGPKALSGKKVTVHYTGRLLDGRTFDSSRLPGREPFSFQLGARQVIKGWEEGIALFHAGGKGTLIIPSVLGYGERGAGSIPPNSILIFDIEVLEVK
ncbi:MAG: FKBP-type peptidyl-prolyl cis-trans isomerase [Chitinophagales bacterium]|nr:FKBP-type peptidyl-prolyl cis-trans isomerase [Chitinophagales bacterium]MDW8427441.1 FKBP-type peptidyl-prolyl cis-trans isomerase [Chitinophagales bacterium]